MKDVTEDPVIEAARKVAKDWVAWRTEKKGGPWEGHVHTRNLDALVTALEATEAKSRG